MNDVSEKMLWYPSCCPDTRVVDSTLDHIGWYLSMLVGERKDYVSARLVAWTDLERLVRVLRLDILAVLPKTSAMTPYKTGFRSGCVSSERLEQALRVLQEAPILKRIGQLCHDLAFSPIHQGKDLDALLADLRPQGGSLSQIWYGILESEGTEESPIVMHDDSDGDSQSESNFEA